MGIYDPKPIWHRDGTVTVWDVYDQQWLRARPSQFSDEIYASLSRKDRDRLLRMLEKEKRGNPARVKLPTKPTPAKVWVDTKGKVKILIEKNPFGGTGRFAKCVESVEARGGVQDARAVCAAAGRKKYGKKKFAAMAKAGKKRAARKR